MILVTDSAGRTHAYAGAAERRALHMDSATFCRLYVVRPMLFERNSPAPSVAFARLMLDVSFDLQRRAVRA